MQAAPAAMAPPAELRGQRLHRAGNITGLAGVGGILAGTVLAVGSFFCNTGDCAAGSLLGGVLMASAGGIAVEVGAPMALAGAGMAHKTSAPCTAGPCQLRP